MAGTSRVGFWRRLVQWRNVGPGLAILGAVLAVAVQLLRGAKVDPMLGVIVGLLVVLAVDALVERMSILEDIRAGLDSLSATQSLRSRQVIPSVRQQAEHASEIRMLAVSATTTIPGNHQFFEEKIEAGCKVRVLLMNPQAERALDLLAQQSLPGDIAQWIRVTLDDLQPLMELKQARGACQVRLSDVFLPFSMLQVSLGRDRGSMVVEYHAYKSAPDERPHIVLDSQSDRRWYEFYLKQFEQVWSDAKDAYRSPY